MSLLSLTPRAPATVQTIALMLAVALLTGCASTFPEPPQGGIRPAESIYNLPARQAYDLARGVVSSAPLSLSIEEPGGGVIQTGWQSFPGEFHIARRWQERTRYRVVVTPDFDDPAGRSRVSVSEITEQRRSDGHDWTPAFDLQRPDRAAAVLAKIDQAARAVGK
jgi:hypothetical protein